jgi:hypothetical protein
VSAGGEPRTTPARPDLADSRLQGIVRAAAYALPRAMRCRAPAAALRRGPDLRAEQEDQLLHGELFDVVEEQGAWSWGQAPRDGYVGFIASDALGAAAGLPTHWVRALRAYGFERPQKKAAFRGPYALNALVAASGRAENGFLDCGETGWIFEAHLERIGRFETDAAAVAERHLGAPYIWGGRDSQGLDCSGLVQQALLACGRACPRDADLQLDFFRRPVERAQLGRGDLVFWPGHVGMMLDGERMIHATDRYMAVAVERLEDAIRQIGAEPVALRRP